MSKVPNPPQLPTAAAPGACLVGCGDRHLNEYYSKFVKRKGQYDTCNG